MKLLSVQIKNFRSIDELEIEIAKLEDDSFTYGLIGINEAGKSSVLKAIALKDGLISLSAKDFLDRKKPVEIIFNYEISVDEINFYNKEAANQKRDDDPNVGVIVAQAAIALLGELSSGLSRKISITYAYRFQEFSAPATVSVKLPSTQEALPNYTKHLLSKVHQAIFWTAEDKFLISKPIDLDDFAEDPDISIPLRNCFALAGIDDIQTCVSGLSDSTEKEHLEETLGNHVTEHIKTVWPNHPIKITFDIDDLIINFHVKDSDEIGGKAKTAGQRSDGFKQFISFLLTVSAQNRNELLNNVILLLDEPETHLHPQAQEYLLDEFIKITKNDRNNIVFFATHSNYMIDKNDLSRNFKIEKIKGKTIKTRFCEKIATYASVSYDVFDVPSSDYHNELYAAAHCKFKEDDQADRNRVHINEFDKYLNAEKGLPLSSIHTKSKADNGSTLPTYVRNCIHHPDNGYKFTKDDLLTSIKLLRDL